MQFQVGCCVQSKRHLTIHVLTIMMNIEIPWNISCGSYIFNLVFFEGDNSAQDAVLNISWTEFEQFQSWEGVFGGGQSYIWKTKTYLVCGNSRLWHKMYSFQYTTWLGKFACHVTSKILGIGAAELNWGEVKHLKTDKWSHLGVSIQISN